jgi:hypothetical protein
MSTSWRETGDPSRTGYRRGLSHFQSRTDRRPVTKKNLRTTLGGLALVAAVGGSAPPWPPFLPARDTFPPDLAVSVERVWTDPTLSRTVRGRSASVPFDTYLAFVDAPDVTTAAARFLKLGRYQVKALAADWYEADDHDGSRGIYRILLREPHRRVVLSWGEHHGRILGAIGGSALTVIDLRERDGVVDQELAAYVRIDNAFAAALARLLLPIFGHLADRKLSEGFAVTAKVAEWAVAHPGDFCAWLRREPFPSERREPLLQALPACRPQDQLSPPDS